MSQAFLVLFGYGIIMSFNAILNKFLTERFGFTPTISGYLSAIPTLVCAIFYPIVGYFIDEYGYLSLYQIFCFVFTSSAHIIFIFTPQ